MPVAASINRTSRSVAQAALRCRTAGALAVLLAVGCNIAAAASAPQCPPLQSYYPATNPATQQAWESALPRIDALLESCLQSAEYFALRGAAQLNTGQLSQALESLERALLIDPQNGAASIDYAEGLYLAGQLFPALEINDSLLARQDLPANLKPMLLARQQSWRQQTRTRQFALEATSGYDNNLNGAPTRSDLTLTFGGVPVSFILDPANQAQQGSFANVRLGGVWQWLTSTHQHSLVATARARQAFAGDADLAQTDWRYTYALPTRRNRWEVSAGTSHMLFGGSPLYSVADVRGRVFTGSGTCRTSVEVGFQHLNYHGQTLMNGRETSLTTGYGCQMPAGQQVRVEAGLLSNLAVSTDRPGGDRQGWNLRLNWQTTLAGGEFNAQLGYARLKDGRGYSPLLENGTTREVASSYLNLRYKYPLARRFALLVSLTNQAQRSNLDPFQNRGTAAEVGLALDF